MEDAVKRILENLGQKPLFLTASSQITAYQQPIVDKETQVQGLSPHRVVSGHFQIAPEPTNFKLYLPEPSHFRNRFLQHVYPLQGDGAAPTDVTFSFEQGAYHVHVTGSNGYYHLAAVAMFGRQFASKYYNVRSDHINGYIYGGSLGSIQTTSALENTEGIWQGGVPYVQAIPYGMTTGMTANALLGLVLSNVCKNTLRNMASSEALPNGLSKIQRDVVLEVTRLGLAWKALDIIGLRERTEQLAQTTFVISLFDPGYASDFWSLPGYVGTEESELGDFFRGLRYSETVDILELEGDDHRVQVLRLAELVNRDYLGATLTLLDAQESPITTLKGSMVGSILTLSATLTRSMAIHGKRLKLDNDLYLAAFLYHRHQVPDDLDAVGWTQYRDTKGQPIYPQRPRLVSVDLYSGGGNGALASGRLRAKTIVISSHQDIANYPWFSNWYRQRVFESLGSGADSTFRLYVNENAPHEDGPVQPGLRGKVVDYEGLLNCTIVELMNWAEKDQLPADSTRYHMRGSQMILPAKASERSGIQPVVTLSAECQSDNVEEWIIKACVEVPPMQGYIEEVQWDWSGEGEYEKVDIPLRKTRLEFGISHTFPTSGSHSIGLEAISIKHGQRLFGLGRVVVPALEL